MSQFIKLSKHDIAQLLNSLFEVEMVTGHKSEQAYDLEDMIKSNKNSFSVTPQYFDGIQDLIESYLFDDF